MSFFDRSVGLNNGTGATTLTGTISTATPGEMLLLLVDYASTTPIGTPPTIGGNNMTIVPGGTGTSGGSHRQELWSYIAPTTLSSAAVVVTLPSSVSAAGVIAAFDGPTAIAAVIKQAYGGSGGSTGTVNVAITTPDAYDYLVAFYGAQVANSPGAGTGFTALPVSNSSQALAAGIYANSATATPGATNAIFSITPGINAGNFFALALRTGPLMASVSFAGTTGTLTWATASGGALQSSGFGATQGLSGTASGGAFTISGVSTTGLTTTFTTSRALGAGETGTLSTLAGAFTDSSSTSNPCPAGTIAFTIAGVAVRRRPPIWIN